MVPCQISDPLPMARIRIGFGKRSLFLELEMYDIKTFFLLFFFWLGYIFFIFVLYYICYIYIVSVKDFNYEVLQSVLKMGIG